MAKQLVYKNSKVQTKRFDDCDYVNNNYIWCVYKKNNVNGKAVTSLKVLDIRFVLNRSNFVT